MPPKRKLIFKSKIHSSSSMARFLPNSSSSSSSSSSASSSISSSIDLTNSPPSTILSTTSISRNQKGGRMSYIWNHGEEYLRDGEARWQCNYCLCNYVGSVISTQWSHLDTIRGISDPKATMTEDGDGPGVAVNWPIRARESQFVAENHAYDWSPWQLTKRFPDWEIDVKYLKLWPQSFIEKCISLK